MEIFKNFIVVVIIVGVVTRLSRYILSKYIDNKITVIYISSIGCGILICSIASVIVGFDVVISEYLMAFILWFVFDLMRVGVKK